jgi:soluble lytic murein transglycosylase-like protein
MNAIRKLYRTVCNIIKGLFVLGFGTLFLIGAVFVSGGYKPDPQIVEKIREVAIERPEPDIKTLIREIPEQYGLSPLLVAAIVERESGAKRDAVRFEPGQMERARRLTKNEQDQRMLATSFGYMQIMGWWSKEFNISWADLLDGETNVETGCAILKKCLDRQKSGNKAQRIHAALACYNGSTVYADAVLSRLAALLIEKEL